MSSAEPRSGSRVFLSFAKDDSELAQQISDRLAASGISAATHTSVLTDPGVPAWQQLQEQIRASDVLVVLLSPASSTSAFVVNEVATALTEDLDRRGVDVIPVIAAPTILPPALRDRQAIDLTADVSGGVERLVKSIEAMSQADFATLTPRTFERLVADLLRAVGFDVEEDLRPDHSGVDMRATYQRGDPFGGANETEVWLVEAKLYSHQRVSIRGIQQLAGAIAMARPGTRGLLITNGQLTSVTREYVTNLSRDSHVRLRVIDGVELRRLLREYQGVTVRYFNSGVSHLENDADN